MRKTIIFCLLSVVSVFAQNKESAAADTGKPNIAVYVTGNVSEDERSALGTRILAALVNSGRYRGIERSNTFLDEIDREMVRQRSGAIDDNQISELGKQFGVKFICITDITPVRDAFLVSARIINVETAEVAFIGEAFCQRMTALYITWVSDQVVRKMFGEKPLPEPRDPSRMNKTALLGGIGCYAAGAGLVAWGFVEDRNIKKYKRSNQGSKEKNSEKNRNTLYAAGAALLVTGISVHIIF